MFWNKSKVVFYRATTWIYIGALLLLVSELYLHRTDMFVLLSSIVAQFGIALIVMGIVGIILQFEDMKKYFQDRLKDVVIQRSYLENLSEDELKAVQVDTLKAKYKNTDIDKDGSFLHYFQNKIQDYIGCPYRENVSSSILIDKNGTQNGTFLVYDTTIYTCRANGGKIQDEVKWLYEEDEFEDILDVKLILRCPKSKDIECHGNCNTHTECEDGVITFNKIELDQKYSNGKPKGYLVKLNDLMLPKDKLQVELTTKYIIKESRMFSWTMTHPSRGVTFTITHPVEYKLVEFVAGIEPREYNSNRNGNMYIFKHEGWFLPRTGISWNIVKQ